jgi:hypothetical protein
MHTSRGEVWLVLEIGCRAVEKTLHQKHETESECVIELILTSSEGEPETGDPVIFRIERSHALAEIIDRYNDEATGEDVLVILPGETPKYAMVPRRRFHETIRTTATTSRSDIMKYIQ